MTSRLRILFLASYFPKPDNPLMGTWALTQAQALARQEVELRVVSFTSWVPRALAKTSGAKAYANCPEVYTWHGGVQVHYPRWLYYPVPPVKQWAYRHPQPYLSLAKWSAERYLYQQMESFKPDVLFCHHALPNGWLVAQLPPQFCKPLIVQEHDFDEIADCRLYPQRKAALQQVVDRAWAMLTVSHRMQQNMLELFPAARIYTCHNGVHLPDPKLWSTPRPEVLKDRIIILACALFAERKGIPTLVEAFHHISAKHPNAVLRIIGGGPEEQRVRETIARLKVEDRVQLVGKKPHQEVLQEMVWADCFALVGWDEPFATVYLEAMAAGKPIICCNDGGITDVVQDGVHGYTVPPRSVAATAEAIDRMLSNSAQRLQMGHNAQRLIQQHLTWEVKAKELIQLMETAVRNHRQPSLSTAIS
ncbi:MAG: glycosyltransferase [Synechococcales cyanobacterium C42_A2020_086]|jgi:glycosyltransferase involved in cell wall biosynthesis|nr:glycosyltransferase [Synechococcales cyanobacterium C42_A2020_086]